MTTAGEMMATKMKGGCLCGAIRYQATGAPIAQLICHCETCRRAIGAASVAWVTFQLSEFEFLMGKPTRFRSSAAVVRTFCNQCGTSLTYQPDSSPDEIDVTAATLDDPKAFVPTREVWTDQHLAWQSLNPRLPHYPRSTAAGE
jgi:hypothetical protein